jgi:histone H3/H4
MTKIIQTEDAATEQPETRQEKKLRHTEGNAVFTKVLSERVCRTILDENCVRGIQKLAHQENVLNTRNLLTMIIREAENVCDSLGKSTVKWDHIEQAAKNLNIPLRITAETIQAAKEKHLEEIQAAKDAKKAELAAAVAALSSKKRPRQEEDGDIQEEEPTTKKPKAVIKKSKPAAESKEAEEADDENSSSSSSSESESED